MYISKRKEIMKALREEKARKREGFDAGHINPFVNRALKNLDRTIKTKDGRNSLEFVTGIKTKKVGPIIL